MVDHPGQRVRRQDREHQLPHRRDADAHRKHRLDEQDSDEQHEPDAVRRVPRRPRQRQPTRAEPDRVDPVHLVIGTEPHAQLLEKTKFAMLSAKPKNSPAPAITTQPSITFVIVIAFWLIWPLREPAMMPMPITSKTTGMM